jgi:hypothetical protein
MQVDVTNNGESSFGIDARRNEWRSDQLSQIPSGYHAFYPQTD